MRKEVANKESKQISNNFSLKGVIKEQQNDIGHLLKDTS
jgi:hypothetical protein